MFARAAVDLIGGMAAGFVMSGTVGIAMTRVIAPTRLPGMA